MIKYTEKDIVTYKNFFEPEDHLLKSNIMKFISKNKKEYNIRAAMPFFNRCLKLILVTE